MKTCPLCNGKMWRHQGHELKSGEKLQRFRCVDCKFIESFYFHAESQTWTPEKRRKGRPYKVDEVVFVSKVSTWMTPQRIGA